MIGKEDGFDLHLKWHFPDAKRYAFTLITLIVSLVIIYGNSFNCEWHFDDIPNIVDNVNVHMKSLSWTDIEKSFCHNNRITRPLAYLSFALNYYFGGKEVFGYHLVNLIIHYLASVFLFLFLYSTLNLPILRAKYKGSAYAIALLATFLWAWNPVQVHAVTYIVQRMASMAAMFHIVAMYFYVKGRTSVGFKRRFAFFVLGGFAALLAFASKQNATMLPISLFLYDLFLIQGVTRENIRKSLKLFIVPLIIVVILGLISVDLSYILEGYENRPFSLWERLLTEPRVIVFYITLLFYPIGSRLALLHDIDISRSLIEPWGTFLAIILIAIILGTALAAARKRPLISFSVLFFFLNHAIEGSIFPLELIYEHRNYLPSLMLFVLPAILMVYVLQYFSYKKSVQFTIAFGISFFLAAQGHTTFERNSILKTEAGLWFDNVSKTPGLSRTHNNLGKVYWDAGLNQEAFEAFKKAIELDRWANVRQAGIVKYNLGQYYFYEKKDYARAFAQYKKSLEIHPNYPPALEGMAMVALINGDTTGAYELIHKAISYSSSRYQAELHRSLSLVLFKSGRIKECIDAAGKAMEIDPDLSDTIGIIAEALRKTKKYNKSIKHWKRYLIKKPTCIRGHLALIELYQQTENANLLKKAVRRVIYIKGERSLYEVICRSRENEELKAYVPDLNNLLGIINVHVTEQTRDLEESMKCN